MFVEHLLVAKSHNSPMGWVLLSPTSEVRKLRLREVE